MTARIFYDMILKYFLATGKNMPEKDSLSRNLRTIMDKTTLKKMPRLLTPMFPNPKTAEESLAELGSTQKHMADIQKNLSTIVNAAYQHSSFLGRASESWGRRPLWQKIIGSVLFFGAFFLIGILAHIVTLIVIGGLSATVFAVGSYLLEEHHKTSKRHNESLNAGVLSLAHILESVVLALDNIRVQIAVEIDKFKQENTNFARTISTLKDEMIKLTDEVKQLVLTKHTLVVTQEKLAVLTKDHELLNSELGKSIAELANLKSSTSLEIKRLTEVTAVLKGTSETLMTSLVSDETQRAAFQTKMEAFLLTSSTQFSDVAERICAAEKELVVTQAALKESMRQHSELLEKQGTYVEKLEKACGFLEVGSQMPPQKLAQTWMAMFSGAGVPLPCALQNGLTTMARS